MIHHAGPSWPRKHLRRLRWQRRLGPGFYLVCATAIGSLAALMVWHGTNLSRQRFTFVLSLTAMVWGLSWYLWFTGNRIRPAAAGLRAEQRALLALNKLPSDAQTWSNLRLPGWPYDLDLIVITGKKLVVIEVKSDPGQLIQDPGGQVYSHRRDHMKPLDDHLRMATTRAIRFKLHLIHAAKHGRLPPGIPTPHVLVAIDPLHASQKPCQGPIVHAEALAQAIDELPNNIPPILCQALPTFLSGEATA